MYYAEKEGEVRGEAEGGEERRGEVSAGAGTQPVYRLVEWLFVTKVLESACNWSEKELMCWMLAPVLKIVGSAGARRRRRRRRLPWLPASFTKTLAVQLASRQG